MSPDVNNMYPNNADCVYQITVPPMYKVFFKVERLILQDKGENFICSDYLEVNINLTINESRIFNIQSH